jgi:hypothetical protein
MISFFRKTRKISLNRLALFNRKLTFLDLFGNDFTGFFRRLATTTTRVRRICFQPSLQFSKTEPPQTLELRLTIFSGISGADTNHTAEDCRLFPNEQTDLFPPYANKIMMCFYLSSMFHNKYMLLTSLKSDLNGTDESDCVIKRAETIDEIQNGLVPWNTANIRFMQRRAAIRCDLSGAYYIFDFLRNGLEFQQES